MDKFIYSLIEFFSAIIGIVILTLSLIGLRDFHHDTNAINLYKENWEKGPIKEIIKSSQAEGCPASYEPLISDTYPGYFSGCDCMSSDSLSFSSKAYKENCTQTQLTSHCSPIQPTLNKTLTNWQGTNLCVKRLAKNFWALKLHTIHQECPQGKRSCGSVDSYGNSLCIDIAHDCPINYIEIVKKDTQPSHGLLPGQVKMIALENDYTLYYSKEATGDKAKIFIDFKVNTHRLCYEPNEGLLGQSDHILNRLHGLDSCQTYSDDRKLYDSRFEVMNRADAIEFYKNNGVVFPTNSSLVSPIGAKGHILLYTSNYIGWMESCYHNHKDHFTIDQLLLPNTTDNYAMAYLIGIVAVIYYMFLISMFALMMMLEDSKEKNVLWMIVAIFEICLLMVMLGLAIVIIYKTIIMLQPYQMFKSLGCAEEITTHAFDIAYKKLMKINNYFIPFCFFTLFDVVCRITFYAYLFLIKK